jgi:hypothetical protein
MLIDSFKYNKLSLSSKVKISLDFELQNSETNALSILF